MRPLVLLVALSLAGCDSDSLYVCTASFDAVTVEVVNAAGRPVPGLSAVSVNERTGEPLSGGGAVADARNEDGVYVVATDADLGALRVDGDPVRFIASGESVRASATFVIADDGCHVTKEEGPDQITAEPL